MLKIILMFEWLRHWRFGKQYGYEMFFRFQDRRPAGRTGIILSDLGMPEDYQIVAPIIVGHPVTIPSPPKRKEAQILKVIA